MLQIKFMSSPCEIVLRWMPQNLFGDKSISLQIMAWCWQQGKNPFIFTRSVPPYGVNGPQWVYIFGSNKYHVCNIWLTQVPNRIPNITMKITLAFIMSNSLEQNIYEHPNHRCTFCNGATFLLFNIKLLMLKWQTLVNTYYRILSLTIYYFHTYFSVSICTILITVLKIRMTCSTNYICLSQYSIFANITSCISLVVLYLELTLYQMGMDIF